MMDRRSKTVAKKKVSSGPAGPRAPVAVRSPMSPSRRALVLNATFEPLGIVSSRRAVLLVLDTKAELVHTTERVFRAEHLSVPEPSVVRLVRYVQIPRHYRVAVNRRTVFARDGSRCQYCGSAAENLDHVIPRSKGGPHTWENVVAACRRCNTRKEDRLPHEAGMVLRSTPMAPRHRVQLLALCGGGSEDWGTYLGTAPAQAPPAAHRLSGPHGTGTANRGAWPVTGDWWVDERAGDAATLHAAWPRIVERPDRRAVAVCRVSAPAVVLGSTQSEEVVDGPRAAAAGVSVARRRSGGGAVLVVPGDPAWIDVYLPRQDPLWHQEVDRAFDWLGDAWVDALGRNGLTGLSAHRQGYRSCTRWSSLVCFGGVGTGEVVTDDGRKVVGLAQRRTRQGAWFHGACVLRWDPADWSISWPWTPSNGRRPPTASGRPWWAPPTWPTSSERGHPMLPAWLFR